MESPVLGLFPITAEVKDNRLFLGGCDCRALAQEFGTPLYVFDEATLRSQCREFLREFGSRYPQAQVIYAAQAGLLRPLARLPQEEGLGRDVVSGGELGLAREAGFPLDRVYFHGNNKSPQELAWALDWGVGRVVVDNFYELELLEGLARERGRTQDVLLRLSPGVDPHTPPPPPPPLPPRRPVGRGGPFRGPPPPGPGPGRPDEGRLCPPGVQPW